MMLRVQDPPLLVVLQPPRVGPSAACLAPAFSGAHWAVHGNDGPTELLFSRLHRKQHLFRRKSRHLRQLSRYPQSWCKDKRVDGTRRVCI